MENLRGNHMQLGDTPERYGAISRLLHWSMAALILWQLTGMVLKVTLGRDHQITSTFFMPYHSAIGTVLFCLIVLRVVWLILNRANRPGHPAGMMGLAARLGHFGLYALMFIVPCAALLRAWGGERAFALFGFEIFPARTPEDVVAPAVAIGNALHGELAWVMGALILGHVFMALFHQFVLRDRLFKRIAH